MNDPRTQFAQTDHFKAWNAVSASAAFQAASDTAMLILSSRQSSPADYPTAAANSYRMEGAHQFLEILSRLTETTQVRKPVIRDNLDHNR